jgi:hypothetical protein
MANFLSDMPELISDSDTDSNSSEPPLTVGSAAPLPHIAQPPHPTSASMSDLDAPPDFGQAQPGPLASTSYIGRRFESLRQAGPPLQNEARHSSRARASPSNPEQVAPFFLLAAHISYKIINQLHFSGIPWPVLSRI